MKTKNLVWSTILFAVMAMFAISCDDETSGSESDGVDSTMVHFSIDATDVYNPVFTNTSEAVGIATWDFGNGLKGSGDQVSSSYALAGTYNVTMTLIVDGDNFTNTMEYVLETTNPAYFDNDLVNALTGGTTNTDGKVWVIDRWANSHMQMYNNLTDWQWWWGAEPNDKEGLGMYDDEYTLKVTDQGIMIDMLTNGDVYVNSNLTAVLDNDGFTGTQEADGADFIYNHDGGTFNVNVSMEDSTIIFPDGGFMGYFGGYKPAEYVVVEYTETTLSIGFVVGMTQPVDGAGSFVLVFAQKGYETPEPEAPTTGIFDDDFESGELDARWQLDGQDATSILQVTDTPSGSGKVFQFSRQAAFYPNIYQMQDAGNYFDFASAGVKVAMDVYVPASNDYTTDGGSAGSWISIPEAGSTEPMSIEVKFQNSSKGGDAWQTQMVVKSDVLKDYAGQWVTLLVDLSDAYAANGNDDKDLLDKFVLQFGSEGYSYTNQIDFYFDNLRWFDGSKTAETGWVEIK